MTDARLAEQQNTQFDYINRTYGLNVRVGTKLKFQGRPAIVSGVRGASLLVSLAKPFMKTRRCAVPNQPNVWSSRFESVPSIIHPTWEVEYEKL